MRNFQVTGTAFRNVNGQNVPYPNAPILVKAESILADPGNPANNITMQGIFVATTAEMV